MGHVTRFRLAFLALGLLALPLGGCGRRGPLELPAGAPSGQTPAAAEAQQDRVLNDGAAPGLIQSRDQVLEPTPAAQAQQLAARASSPVAPRAINAPPGEKRGTFFLDPLLQ